MARPSRRCVANIQQRFVASGKLKKWPQPVVESHGDYRADAYLEKTVIGGPLYANQASLPSLPVPSIEDTLSRFLPTALPLVESKDEKENLLSACAGFPTEAAKLQRKLETRRESEQVSSWLQLWWNTAGYLQFRDPISINVSYFFQLSDDETLPPCGDGRKSLGVMRAAAVLKAVGEYRKKVCSGELPVETIGRKDPKIPLCSVAFKYMFNACRIPRKEQDSYRMYDPSLHKHCIVARKGLFFAVDFVDDEGNPLPFAVLESLLQLTVELADEIQEHGDVLKLGWLTSDDRDSWANAREELINAGGSRMEQALARLESGAFLLCLDDKELITPIERGEAYWHGGLSHGMNRWHDKSIQMICSDNGKLGFLGEHSMGDGMPMVGLCQHIIKTNYDSTKCEAALSPFENAKLVSHIFQDCLPALDAGPVANLIASAKGKMSEYISRNELHVQRFQGYGSAFIKNAGHSPDAYVQMAIQLASYRLFGKQCATYESTQVRPYLHGRTETTRSVSPASAAFVERMGLRRGEEEESDITTKEMKASMLAAATASHIEYIGAAARGMGVDRHFLGLAMLLERDDEAPSLFSDPVFIRSKTWKISTSTLPNAPGFGPVVEDGVGVAYEIKPRSVTFTISCRRQNNWSEALGHLLEEALLEMKTLDVRKSKCERSKL